MDTLQTLKTNLELCNKVLAVNPNNLSAIATKQETEREIQREESRAEAYMVLSRGQILELLARLPNKEMKMSQTIVVDLNLVRIHGKIQANEK